MSEKIESNAIELFKEASSLIISASGQMDFGQNAEVVNWAEISEAIDPQGALVKCADIVGQYFTIRKLKPFESILTGEAKWVYWVVGQMDTGQYFNTVLGGQAIVEEIEKIIQINRLAKEAYDNGDVESLQHYMRVGAGKSPRIAIQLNKGGRFGKYYTISRS